jgi:hypothetical protein
MKTQYDDFAIRQANSDPAKYSDIKEAAFMLTNLFERQREIQETFKSLRADPFILLKEVTEMSRFYNLSKQQDSIEQQYARA